MSRKSPAAERVPANVREAQETVQQLKEGELFLIKVYQKGVNYNKPLVDIDNVSKDEVKQIEATIARKLQEEGWPSPPPYDVTIMALIYVYNPDGSIGKLVGNHGYTMPGALGPPPQQTKTWGMTPPTVPGALAPVAGAASPWQPTAPQVVAPAGYQAVMQPGGSVGFIPISGFDPIGTTRRGDDPAIADLRRGLDAAQAAVKAAEDRTRETERKAEADRVQARLDRMEADARMREERLFGELKAIREAPKPPERNSAAEAIAAIAPVVQAGISMIADAIKSRPPDNSMQLVVGAMRDGATAQQAATQQVVTALMAKPPQDDQSIRMMGAMSQVGIALTGAFSEMIRTQAELNSDNAPAWVRFAETVLGTVKETVQSVFGSQPHQEGSSDTTGADEGHKALPSSDDRI